LIKVIDLFAGPGGLGEGFSSVKAENGTPFFDIKLSIEKEPNAHKTLALRSFYRQFIKTGRSAPREYYELLRESNLKERDRKFSELFELYLVEGNQAKAEAQLIELGSKKYPSEVVDLKIKTVLQNDPNWILIGGPPCQAYSMAGRSRIGGLDPEDHRVYLYREYLRIIAVHHPAVFVMENVKGILSAKVGETRVFEWIKTDIRNPGRLFPGHMSPKYRIFSFAKETSVNNTENNPVYKKDNDFLIKSEFYSIPQKRHRVILLGIREDINATPHKLTVKDKIPLSNVIGLLPKIRSEIGRSIKETIIINGKVKRIYQKFNDNNFNWKIMLESLRNEIVKWNELSESSLNSFIYSELNSNGSEFIPYNDETIDRTSTLYNWIYDCNLGGVINHQSRSHLFEDIRRYLFLSIYSSIYNKFPRLQEYSKFSNANQGLKIKLIKAAANLPNT
jgi:DNA (cytosine-5)-methyltransferase 1